MTKEPSLTVYLAGPVSNCNDKQKTEWRIAVKSKLTRFGHKCIDPTDHTTWTPFKEMVEIDKSDVVIANLWRESVGTVVGIVQARRKGKPVILIDPNFLQSYVLEQIVGKDLIVRGIDEAVHQLPRVYEQFSRAIMVRKGSGELQAFTFPKLHDSLYAVCAKAHIEDVVLPDLVAHEVHRVVRKAGKGGEIASDHIKRLIFATLNDIARDNEDELKECAVKLKREWEEYEKVKKNQRVALEMMTELHGANRDLKEENASLVLKVRNLELRLKGYERGLISSDAQAEEPRESDTLASMVERALGKKRGLCICGVGKPTFASAFERHGIAQDDFARLFEMRLLEGKQSNLNQNLKSWVGAYPYVLYAWDGLRHLSPDLRKTPNLYWGAVANEAVKRFLEGTLHIKSSESSTGAN
ncbi:MAG TPA: hypothetical protein VGQ12_17500 [Candidatus Angelobacter sp.]|jgi:transcriptional regulator NrdR family protein|nr:hypothetical protein [Candidatus Angelobacter sp.]